MNVHEAHKAIRIRGSRRDLFSLISTLIERRRRIRQSSRTVPQEGRISALAETLHPRNQTLKVESRKQLGPGAWLYTLKADSPDGPAPFRAGAYLSLNLNDSEDQRVSRPYSICSSPAESRKRGGYTICVKSGSPSFVAESIHNAWTEGSTVNSSDPQGFFNYEALRDGNSLLFIAGGSGITPFRSLSSDILENHPETRIALLHGAATEEQLYFAEDFRELQQRYPHRFHWIPVLSESSAPDSRIRHGLIDAALIEEFKPSDSPVLFVCGPPALHRHIDQEVKSSESMIRRIRREDYGFSGSPSDASPFTLTVHMGDREYHVPADPGESVLVALERGGLNPPSNCRNGTCGSCRSRLRSGAVKYDKNHPGLRKADRTTGFFHPCVSTPESDMMIEIPARSADSESDEKLPRS